MSSHEVLFRIYYLLKHQPHSIQELHEKLLEEKFDLSKRSVYRYVERLAESLRNGTEVLDIEEDMYNKQYFFVRSLNPAGQFSQNEWLLFLNNYFVFKSIFNLSTDEINLNKRILNHSLSNIPLKAQMTSVLDYSEDMLFASRFGELNLNDLQKRVLYKFLYYRFTNCPIQIDQYTSLVKDNRFLPLPGTPLIAVDIFLHKGNYCLRLLDMDDVLHALEIDMIYSISKVKSIDKTLNIKEIKARDSVRFGYHPPLVSGVHEVKFLFPPNPGEHVIHRNWHPSQQFKRLPDNFIEFTMRVEINIELLGWIGMWLDNVKVLGPALLVDMMADRVRAMSDILEENQRPVNNG